MVWLWAPWQEATALDEPFAKPEALEAGQPWGDALRANDAFTPIPASIPVTLAHGTADTDVPVKVARQMRDELCESGAVVGYREYEGEGHDVPSIKEHIAQWATFRREATRQRLPGTIVERSRCVPLGGAP